MFFGQKYFCNHLTLLVTSIKFDQFFFSSKKNRQLTGSRSAKDEISGIESLVNIAGWVAYLHGILTFLLLKPHIM